MDAALHRIEALPGQGRYAVTFERADGSEQNAVVQLTEDSAHVAESSLPAGWTRGSAAFQAVTEAVRAFDTARRAAAPARRRLQDVAGGWDVGLGNVVLGPGGVPECTAHGPLDQEADRYVCAECGASAVLA